MPSDGAACAAALALRTRVCLAVVDSIAGIHSPAFPISLWTTYVSFVPMFRVPGPGVRVVTPRP